ncbi:hypothetical protein ACMFMG_009533 [Clarireedia jacksonii]
MKVQRCEENEAYPAHVMFEFTSFQLKSIFDYAAGWLQCTAASRKSTGYHFPEIISRRRITWMFLRDFHKQEETYVKCEEWQQTTFKHNSYEVLLTFLAWEDLGDAIEQHLRVNSNLVAKDFNKYLSSYENRLCTVKELLEHYIPKQLADAYNFTELATLLQTSKKETHSKDGHRKRTGGETSVRRTRRPSSDPNSRHTSEDERERPKVKASHHGRKKWL